jgi:hypothetical protein
VVLTVLTVLTQISMDSDLSSNTTWLRMEMKQFQAWQSETQNWAFQGREQRAQSRAELKLKSGTLKRGVEHS